MKRIDPDAMHSWLLGWWGQEVAAQVCPEVAEPYDYHADWTADLGPSGDKYLRWNCNYCGLSRYREPTARHACPERPAEPVCVGPGPDNYGEGFGDNDTWIGPDPAEPVIDEADEDFVYVSDTEVGISGCLNLSAAGEIIEKQARMIRELRSESCGGLSERSPSVSCGSGTASVEPTPTSSKPAPAADPRRLTHEELVDAIATAREGYIYSAVADAQLKKAAKPVTISEAEITKWRWGRDTIRITTLVALLRSNGVEVTP